ncbi:MAG: alpha/beta hydrolase [Rhizobium sp.]
MQHIAQDSWNGRKSRIRLPDGRMSAFIDNGGAGPTLLLLHGYSDSSRSFSLIEPYLEDYRLIMPDLAGHGHSDARTELAVRDFADDVEALIAELGTEPLAVVGHSLGAMTAIELASRRPRSLKALVTVSGTLRPGFPADGDISRRILALSDPIEPSNPFFAFWHASPQQVDRNFLTYLGREAATIPASVWHEVLSGFHDLDLGEAAAEIAVPVLCLAGDKDELFDAGHRRRLSAALPAARSIVMHGFGHNPHWEDPLRVASNIVGFLRDVAQ